MTIQQSLRMLLASLKRGRRLPRAEKLRHRPALECLEGRTVPTMLVVPGDQAGPGFADVIELDEDGAGGLRIVVNGEESLYEPGAFTAVSVKSGGGADLINVLRTVQNVPVTVTSTGNARVVVGNGGSIAGILGRVAITNTASRTTVDVDDSAGVMPRTVGLSCVWDAGSCHTQVAFSGVAPIQVRNPSTRGLTVHTGAAGGQVNIDLVTGRPSLVTHADTTDVSITQGAVVLTGSQTIRNLTLSGGEMRVSGELTVGGTFTWTAGALRGAGQTIAQGTLLIRGATVKMLHSNLLNAGAATWEAGRVFADARAALVNQPEGIFEVRGSTSYEGRGAFVNTGTVQVAAGAGVSRFESAAFVNDGVVEVNSGTLSLGAGRSGGYFAVGEGATLEFRNGTHALTAFSYLYADGRVHFGQSARVTVAGGYYVADMLIGNTGTAVFDADAGAGRFTLESGGTLAGSATLTVDGLFTWTGGTMSGLGRTVALGGLAISTALDKVLDGRTLDNQGEAVWTGGAILFRTTARINNLAGAVFDLRADVALWGPYTASAFTNLGLLRKSAASGMSELRDVALHNAGTVEVLAGTLALNGGGDSTGTFTVAAGATLEFGPGTPMLLAPSRVSGAGQVRFAPSLGAVYVLGSYNVTGHTNVAGGNVHFFTTAPAALGELTISTGTAAFFADAAATSFTLSGGVLGGTATLTVSGLTTWTAGTMGGGGRTVARGGLRISGATSKYFDERTLDNEAAAVWSGGYVSAGLNRSGVINNAVGATFDIEAGADGYYLDAYGQGVFNNRGTLRKLAGAGTADLRAALNNTGTVEVRAGTLRLGYSGNFSSTSTGSFTVQAGATLLFVSPHQLTATATLGGPGRVVIDGPVGHAGSLTFTGGTALTLRQYGVLTVSGTFTQTGGSTVLVGGRLAAAGGINLQGGTLSGSGTIVGNVTNAAAIVVGEAATFGALTITGTYTQTAAGSLALKIGGTTASGRFDRLTVSGAATLAGTLRITLTNGYVPAVGDSVRPLTLGSRTGTFGTLTGDGPLFVAQYDATGLTLRR